MVDIFVYGDESGVFDKAHFELYVFGGIIFLGREDRDVAARKYLSAERCIACGYDLSETRGELKASVMSNKHRHGMYRSINTGLRYCFAIDLAKVNDGIFGDKKTKQRYLDYVYKVGLKRMLGSCIRRRMISSDWDGSIFVRFDEHATATDGKYELRESIEQEFKRGTANYRYNTFHGPLFPSMRGVELTFKDSKKDPLIRASDVIANRGLWLMRSEQRDKLRSELFLAEFP